MNRYNLMAVLALCFGLLAGCSSGDGDDDLSIASVLAGAQAGDNSSEGGTSNAGSSGTTSATDGLDPNTAAVDTVLSQIVGLWQDPNFEPPSYIHISDAGVLETYIPDLNGENCFLGSVIPRYLTHLGGTNYSLGYENISSTEEIDILVNGDTLTWQKTSANTGFTSSTNYSRMSGLMVTDLQLCD